MDKANEFLTFLGDRKKNRLSQFQGYLKSSSIEETNLHEVLNWVNSYELLKFKKFIPSDIIYFNFVCDNEKCYKWGETQRSLRFKKKCPFCEKNKLYLKNEADLRNYFDDSFKDILFYQLENNKNIVYLIYDKKTKNFYCVSGSHNLKEHIYLRLKANKVNCEYLRAYYQDLRKDIESLLVNYIKETLGIKPIHDLGFRPVKERMYFIDNKMFFNCYQGNEYLNFNKSDIPKDKLNINLEKICPNIYLLIRNLTGFNDEAFNYINKYLSFVLQNPSLRTQKVISFYGDEATGKGIFYEYILNKLFEGFVSYIGMEDMESGFNSFYSKKLFVFIDESRHNRQIEQHMLRMTTAKTSIINHKNGKKEEEDIYFNYICASNKEIPMKVGSRRSVYFRSEVLGGDPEKAKDVGKQLVENIPNELEDYFYYLLNMKVSYDDINKGIENEEKVLIEEATRDIKDIFVDTLRSFQDLDKFIIYVNQKSGSNINLSNYLNKQDSTTFVEMSLLFDLYNAFLKSEGWKTTYAHNKMGFIYHKLKIDRDKEINKNLFNREGRRVQFIDVTILSAKIGFDNPTIKDYDETLNKNKLIINVENQTPTLFYQIKEAFNRGKELTLSQIEENFKSIESGELLNNVNKLKQEGVIYEPRKDLFKLVGN